MDRDDGGDSDAMPQEVKRKGKKSNKEMEGSGNVFTVTAVVLKWHM